jgi:hypothetical protein
MNARIILRLKKQLPIRPLGPALRGRRSEILADRRTRRRRTRSSQRRAALHED